MKQIALAILIAVVATPASATSDYCKTVLAKPSASVTKPEGEKCVGPLLVAALCKKWNDGKEKIGCLDEKTSKEWGASSNPDLRSKGETCLAGVALQKMCTT